MLVLSMVGWGSLSLIISCIFIEGISELGAVGSMFAVKEMNFAVTINLFFILACEQALLLFFFFLILE